MAWFYNSHNNISITIWHIYKIGERDMIDQCESCGKPFNYPVYIECHVFRMHRVITGGSHETWTSSPSGCPVYSPKELIPICPYCSTPLMNKKVFMGDIHIWIGKGGEEYATVEEARATYQ